jgi:prepilin-type N-terminal cleavage/methylation domain-containing protein
MRTLRNAGRNAGFTLLELLVVLSILAIIGGGLLVAYDNLDDKASEGVSAHTLASLDSAVRAYVNTEFQLPNELDSLIAGDYPDPSSGTPEKVAILSSKLLGTKTILSTLTAGQVAALNEAGIETLRYVDAKGNDPANPVPGSGDTVTLDCPDADGNAAVVGPLLDMDIPHRAHEVPRPGSNRNRGRGFSAAIAEGMPVLVWNPSRSGGTGGYDNTKVGANPEDVIFVFALGGDASCVGANKGRAQLSSAPVYGKRFEKYEYGRYLLLVNVGPDGNEFDKAKLQVVMNSHGDFVDEMISEYLGQKG